jgi:hypothetical protein
MTKALGGILPWAVVLAAAGGGTWWLLSRDAAAGRWVLAALLIGHSLIHVMFVMPAQSATAAGPDWPFNIARSWALTGVKLNPNVIHVVGMALVAVVVAGFALAALSTVGILVPPGLWQVTVAVSALASAAVLLVFFDLQLVLGIGVDAGLLWIVVARAWAP